MALRRARRRNRGGAVALGVIAEIVLFAYSGRLPPFFQPTMLLIVGAIGATLRWGAMALDPPAMALPFVQLLHALSFGATHLGALGFVRAPRAPWGRARPRKAIWQSRSARRWPAR